MSTATKTLHPDYEAAPVAHRWTGTLAALSRHLRAEAWKARGGMVWWLLPHGACVAACVTSLVSPRYRVRISRRERPAVGHLGAWERELAIFERDLELAGWPREPDEAARGIAVSYTEPLAAA